MCRGSANAERLLAIEIAGRLGLSEPSAGLEKDPARGLWAAQIPAAGSTDAASIRPNFELRLAYWPPAHRLGRHRGLCASPRIHRIVCSHL